MATHETPIELDDTNEPDPLIENKYFAELDWALMAQAYDVERVFSYHAPSPEQVENYKHIRDQGREFAELILELCPASRELTDALKNIENAVMWANAAIARN